MKEQKMEDVQLNLFEEDDGKKSIKKNQDEQTANFLNNTSVPIKCYKSALEKVEYLSLEELFEGFDSIKIFTFSYGMKFLNNITEQFKYAEIIIGAEFTARRGELADLLAEYLTNETTAINSIKKNSSLLEALKNGNIEIRIPKMELIHKKIYLLKSDDGRVRSIVSSANATTRAWDQGLQSEHVEYYDDINMYNELNEEFETSWEDARDILLGEVAISPKKPQDLEGVLENKVKNPTEVIILTPPKDEVEKEHYKYVLSVKNNREKIDEILKGERVEQEKNKIVIIPEKIKKGLNKYKKKKEKIRIINKEKEFPKITIDYEKETALLDGVELPLASSKEELKKAVKNFLDVMEFYNSGLFYGDILSRQKTIFNFLNIDGTKSEKASASTLESIGKKYKKEANTIFFNEFLRRMIPLVKKLIEEINEGRYDTPDGQLGKDYNKEDVISPTLIDKSSQVIMDIVKDCGFEKPDYMSVLDWDKDIDGRGASVIDLVVRDIEKLYRKAPNSFTINEQTIEMLLEKEPKIWRDILPQEAGFTAIKRKEDDCFTATIDRKWIVDHSSVFSKSQKGGLLKRLFRRG